MRKSISPAQIQKSLRFFNDCFSLGIQEFGLLKQVFPITFAKNYFMGLLNQQGKKGDKKQKSKLQNAPNPGSKFIGKNSKSAGGGLNKKGLTGGSRGS
jgi:hypothetical protein